MTADEASATASADGSGAFGSGSRTALDQLETLLWLGVILALIAVIAASMWGILVSAGVAVLIFLAAFTGGAFFGFLFGVPRVLSAEDRTGAVVPVSASDQPLEGDDDAAGTAHRPAAATRLLSSNTNLERISDWLTTLIIGATLAELHNVNDALLSFRAFLTTAVNVAPAGSPPSAGILPVIGPIILVFGAACGFLFMYLSSRLVLIRMFHTVEYLLTRQPELAASEQRTVRAVAREGEVSSFVDQQLGSKGKVTVEDALNLMFDLLYKDDPDQVIRLGDELGSSAARKRPDFWFYLAAAFGQKLHRTQPETPEWDAARQSALDCARRAVALSSSYKDRLWRISDPESSDNDLALLRGDPEFIKIVGR
uniref:hypothetical protein n=1 Tax=Altererythrobacter segetis TaxID=1104773 RepID=UPI00140C2678|nr:hypothetical protein [Altererythrobacter segetis]